MRNPGDLAPLQGVRQNGQDRPKTYGLPEALLLPIAALAAGALNTLGTPQRILKQRNDQLRVATHEGRALIVLPHKKVVKTNPAWPLELREILPGLIHDPQLWVNPAYDSYREAYEIARLQLGPILPSVDGKFLDHIMNREVAILLGYHWVRLCPVDPGVNTNAGHPGGMERAAVKWLEEEVRGKWEGALTISNVTYADPSDLTKMCNVKPGTLEWGLKEAGKFGQQL